MVTRWDPHRLLADRRAARSSAIAITDWSGMHPEFLEITIPKVGEPNPTVRIGVADVRNGEVVWLDTGIPEEHYIPRIYWTSRANTLAVVTLNRPQNQVQLFFFDVTTGERELVFEERSETWLDVYDFFAGIEHFFFFPEGLEEFHWISDRDWLPAPVPVRLRRQPPESGDFGPVECDSG